MNTGAGSTGSTPPAADRLPVPLGPAAASDYDLRAAAAHLAAAYAARDGGAWPARLHQHLDLLHGEAIVVLA